MTRATEQQGIELLYRGKDIHNIPFEDIDLFNQFCEELDLDALVQDVDHSKEFNIPEYYRNIDIDSFVKSRINPQLGQNLKIITARVDMELELYKARNLYPILQLMIYIVDTMRKNDLVWGVGRGSSVASYVLYLLGVHKINSLQYNLDIKEFLK